MTRIGYDGVCADHLWASSFSSSFLCRPLKQTSVQSVLTLSTVEADLFLCFSVTEPVASKALVLSLRNSLTLTSKITAINNNNKNTRNNIPLHKNTPHFRPEPIRASAARFGSFPRRCRQGECAGWVPIARCDNGVSNFRQKMATFSSPLLSPQVNANWLNGLFLIEL